MDGSHAESPSVKGCFFMKKKTYLIPLVLVVLGLLVPIVYAASHDAQGPKHPSSASVQRQIKKSPGRYSEQPGKQPEKQIRNQVLWKKERAVKIYRNNNFK